MSQIMWRTAVVLSLSIISSACSAPRPEPASANSTLVFLTREGCANSARMLANLDVALRSLNRSGAYQVVDQGALPKTDARSGYATPTLLYNNRDVFGLPEPTPPYPEPT